MKFSEKRIKEKRKKLLDKILSTIKKNNDSVLLMPGRQGAPKFDVSDLRWLEIVFEELDWCLFGYVVESPDNQGEPKVAWAAFGPNPLETWQKHLEAVKMYLDFMVDLKTSSSDPTNEITQVEIVDDHFYGMNLNETSQQLITHAEECRIDMQKRFNVNLPPFTYKSNLVKFN